MNLYLIKLHKSIRVEWDMYDSAVVAAKSLEEARNMHPKNGKPIDWIKVKTMFPDWATSIDDVVVEFIGRADDKIDSPGVIVASYNAG